MDLSFNKYKMLIDVFYQGLVMIVDLCICRLWNCFYLEGLTRSIEMCQIIHH